MRDPSDRRDTFICGTNDNPPQAKTFRRGRKMHESDRRSACAVRAPSGYCETFICGTSDNPRQAKHFSAAGRAHKLDWRLACAVREPSGRHDTLICGTNDIAIFFIKSHQASPRPNGIGALYLQYSASRHSIHAQWNCVSANTVAEKSMSVTAFSQFLPRLLFMERCVSMITRPFGKALNTSSLNHCSNRGDFTIPP